MEVRTTARVIRRTVALVILRPAVRAPRRVIRRVILVVLLGPAGIAGIARFVAWAGVVPDGIATRAATAAAAPIVAAHAAVARGTVAARSARRQAAAALVSPAAP